jgi:hypothetical protein
MNTQMALLVVTAATVAVSVLLMSNLACAERPGTALLAASVGSREPGAPALILAAQTYGDASRRKGLWNGVYGSSLGVNPDYGTYKTYGPFYDQTGGYYGSIGQYCAWNGLYPFCYGDTDSFYLGH